MRARQVYDDEQPPKEAVDDGEVDEATLALLRAPWTVATWTRVARRGWILPVQVNETMRRSATRECVQHTTNAWLKAVRQGDVVLVRALLRGDPARATVVGANGDSALHHACANGSEALVRLLLEHGADPLVRNARQYTILPFLVVHGHARLLRTLLEWAGASSLSHSSSSSPPPMFPAPVARALARLRTLFDVADVEGINPLMCACQGQHVDIVRTLLREVAPPVRLRMIAQRTVVGFSALDMCVEQVMRERQVGQSSGADDHADGRTAPSSSSASSPPSPSGSLACIRAIVDLVDDARAILRSISAPGGRDLVATQMSSVPAFEHLDLRALIDELVVGEVSSSSTSSSASSASSSSSSSSSSSRRKNKARSRQRQRRRDPTQPSRHHTASDPDDEQSSEDAISEREEREDGTSVADDALAANSSALPSPPLVNANGSSSSTSTHAHASPPSSLFTTSFAAHASLLASSPLVSPPLPNHGTHVAAIAKASPFLAHTSTTRSHRDGTTNRPIDDDRDDGDNNDADDAADDDADANPDASTDYTELLHSSHPRAAALALTPAHLLGHELHALSHAQLSAVEDILRQSLSSVQEAKEHLMQSSYHAVNDELVRMRVEMSKLYQMYAALQQQQQQPQQQPHER